MIGIEIRLSLRLLTEMIVNPNNTVSQTNPFSLKGRELQKYNLLKYRVISAVLDYIATMNGTILPGMRQPEAFPEDSIYQMLLGCGIISRGKYDTADYNRIMSDMCYMGLIKMSNGYIFMTPYTIEAYTKQTFHQIFASLLTAEDSRKLGHRTLVVSALALIVALASLCISIFPS